MVSRRMVCAALALAACTNTQQAHLADHDVAADVAEVTRALLGTRDSADQALQDRRFTDVRLTQCRVQVVDAPNPSAAEFLYLEQALSVSPDKPYRQKFVRVTPGDGPGKVLSEEFEPTTDAASFQGFCSRPEAERLVTLAQFGTPACTIVLEKAEGARWVGGTRDGGCPTTYRLATRATTEITITQDTILSWERGWDDDGFQVWGPEAGGYRFERINPTTRDTQVNAVAQRLSGRFNNAIQREHEPERPATSVHTCPVALINSPFGNSAHALVETMVNEQRRTRLIVVHRPGGFGTAIVTRFFGLPDSAEAACTDGMVDFATRTDEEGCELMLKPERSTFFGHTPDKGCASTHGGRMEMSLILFPWMMQLTEEHFDAAGNQVGTSFSGRSHFELAEEETP